MTKCASVSILFYFLNELLNFEGQFLHYTSVLTDIVCYERQRFITLQVQMLVHSLQIVIDSVVCLEY